ncbi:MAG: hypothetical protein ACFHWX_01150 [Bacteroidota bacterium]
MQLTINRYFLSKRSGYVGWTRIQQTPILEIEFIGLNLATQIFSFRGINMNLDVRIGETNKVNFAITSSVKVDYEVIKRIHLNAGVGLRSFNPILQGGLGVDLLNQYLFYIINQIKI